MADDNTNSAQQSAEDLVVQIGTRTATAPTTDNLRMNVILWGAPGNGKTTLASTAPGVKLWINFDPDGEASIRARAQDRNDIIVLDLSGDSHATAQRFKDADPFSLSAVFKRHPEITTVVFDSMTAFAMLARDNAVAMNKNSTVELPGMNGYSHANALVQRAFVAMLKLTKAHNKHFICTMHEKEVLSDSGAVEKITFSVSTSLIGQLGLQAGEIWYVRSDEKGNRIIAVAPCRKRTPMKTRMFRTNGVPEFAWKYDPYTYEGQGIDTWFEQWKAAGGRAIPLPA